MGPLLLPLLGMGASLIGSLGSSAIGNASNNKTNEMNWKIAQYQGDMNQRLQQQAFQQNQQAWNDANAYNSPTSQMARLKSAGLNPNLVYGNGSVVGNTSTATPQMKAAQFQAPTMKSYQGWNLGLSDAVSTFQTMALQGAQIKNMNTQRDAVEAQIDTERLKQANLTLQNARTDYDLTLAKDLRNATLSKAKADADQSFYDAETKRLPHQTTVFDNSGRDMSVAQRLVLNSLDSSDLKNRFSQSQIDNMTAATRRLIQTADIERFEQELYVKTGLTKSDSIYVRLLRAAAQAFGLDGKFDNMFNPKK